jgi:transcriptional regulator
MFCPAIFREERPEVLRTLIRAHPLATLVSHGPAGLVANLVPFTLVEREDGPDLVRAHLARANDQVEELRQATEALVLFHGPQAYVTPSWYPTKHEHGRAVPTWNYIAVEMRGLPTVIDDADWIRAQIDALTDQQERSRAEPWAVADAPAPFVAGQLRAIVGLEIPVVRIEGKWKVSQNQPAGNRAGVIAGLRDANPLSAMSGEVELAQRA